MVLNVSLPLTSVHDHHVLQVLEKCLGVTFLLGTVIPLAGFGTSVRIESPSAVPGYPQEGPRLFVSPAMIISPCTSAGVSLT